MNRRSPMPLLLQPRSSMRKTSSSRWDRGSMRTDWTPACAVASPTAAGADPFDEGCLLGRPGVVGRADRAGLGKQLRDGGALIDEQADVATGGRPLDQIGHPAQGRS